MSNEDLTADGDDTDGEVPEDPAVAAERALLAQEARDVAGYSFKRIFVHRANLYISQILLSYLQRALPDGTKRDEDEFDDGGGGNEGDEGEEAIDDEDYAAINDMVSEPVPALRGATSAESLDSFIDARALGSRGFDLVASLPKGVSPPLDEYEQRTARLMRNRRRQSEVRYISCSTSVVGKSTTAPVSASTTPDGQSEQSSVKKEHEYDELERELLQCDVAVYNIADADDDSQTYCREARHALEFLHERCRTFQTPKKFILISPTLTWARTKLRRSSEEDVDEDEDPPPFTEDDYRRRRAHAKYTVHQTLEKDCLKCGRTRKTKFLTYVVCVGVVYGMGEGLLHYFFKQAWQQEPYVVLPGKGTSPLALVHIWDLCQILHNVTDRLSPLRYILAVDESQHVTLNDIVRAVVKRLSGDDGMVAGRIKRQKITPSALNNYEDRSVYKYLTSSHQTLMCTTTMRLQAGVVRDDFRMEWSSEQGLLENMERIVREYKMSRMLRPKRICIIGPPCCGKTALAQKLATCYSIPHYSLKSVLTESMAEYQKLLARKTSAEAAAANEDEAEEGAQTANNAEPARSSAGDPAATGGEPDAVDISLDMSDEELELLGERCAFLEDLFSQQELSNGAQLNEAVVPKLFRYKLKKGPAQNQGFVLDGYPNTTQMARDLFSLEQEELEMLDDEQMKLPQYDKTIMPHVVVIMQASENFLEQNQYATDRDEIRRKFDTYRATQKAAEAATGDAAGEGGTADEPTQEPVPQQTVEQYFDYNEIHPLVFDLDTLDVTDYSWDPESSMEPVDTNSTTPQTDYIYRRIIAELGAPTNYGQSRDEFEREQQALFAAQQQRQAAAQEELERMAKSSLVELHTRTYKERWAARYAIIKTEEATMQALRTMPARTYLMKYVVPSLLDGLEECAKVKPNDACEYMADYLMRRVKEAGQSVERAALGDAIDIFAPVAQPARTDNEAGDFHK